MYMKKIGFFLLLTQAIYGMEWNTYWDQLLSALEEKEDTHPPDSHLENSPQPSLEFTYHVINAYLTKNVTPTKIKQTFHYYQDPYSHSIFKCNYRDCTQSFTRLSTLKRHIADHNKPNTRTLVSIAPFALPLAIGKKITKKPALKLIICTYCSKTFKTSTELANHHRRNHSCVKLYKCEHTHCGAQYTTSSSLGLHIARMHTKPKFQCEKCDIQFCLQGDLTQHQKRSSHSGTILLE